MQSLALPMIGVGVGLVAIVAAIWWRDRKRGPQPPDPHPEVPTLRVVALGLEGAGKTVLLASQFHKLSEPVSDRRYFLDDDWEQDRQLARIYASVSDTSAPWPPATRIGNTHTFRFDCRARDRAGHERTLFRISYLDYAGDLLELGPDDGTGELLEPRRSEQAKVKDLTAKFNDADALLVIVDGRRVLQLLRNEDEAHDYFDGRLRPLLGEARRATCPVQLILTKWDLVRSFDDSGDEELLRQVKGRLMSYSRVLGLVQAHCQRQEEVRLIPVSAVGPRFVEVQADGRVVKRPDGQLDPINIDVPLCAVLPDMLKHAEQSLDQSVRYDLEQEIGRHHVGDVASIVRSVLSSPAGRLVQSALSGVVGDEIVRLFVELLVRSKSPDAEPPRDHRDEQRPHRDDEEETRRLRAEVLKDMNRVVDRLEYRLPSSVLCSRW